jgi:hypothetical protein
MFTARQSLLLFGVAVVLSTLASLAAAEEGAPIGHRCVRDDQGDSWCSRFSGGDAFLFVRGEKKEIVCGKGHCLADYYKEGTIRCAQTEDGIAMYDRKGGVVCSGGCEAATKDMCEKLKP